MNPRDKLKQKGFSVYLPPSSFLLRDFIDLFLAVLGILRAKKGRAATGSGFSTKFPSSATPKCEWGPEEELKSVSDGQKKEPQVKTKGSPSWRQRLLYLSLPQNLIQKSRTKLVLYKRLHPSQPKSGSWRS